MEKNRIRKEIFQKRREISEEEVKILNRRVFLKIKNYLLRIEKETADLFAYFPCNHEADTREFLCEWLSEKKRVALPRVGSDGYSMDFYYIDSLEDVEKGYKGIFEPKKTCIKVDNSTNRIILFQKKIGIAFEFQIFDSIVYEENDIRLDAVITEEQIYEMEES